MAAVGNLDGIPSDHSTAGAGTLRRSQSSVTLSSVTLSMVPACPEGSPSPASPSPCRKPTSKRWKEAEGDLAVFEMEGVPVPTVSRANLIASKRTGRPQDVADIQVLEELQRLRR